MAIKLIHKYQPKIHPLHIHSIKYDDDQRKHDTKGKVNIIIETMKRYKIMPNAQQLDNDDEEPIFILSNVISDAAYKAALDTDGNALCDKLLQDSLDLSPLFRGWDVDENHIIESVRKAINKEAPELAVFVAAVKEGLEVLMRPKWTKMMKSLMQNDMEYKFRKWLKLCTTRFWKYFGKSLERINENVPAAFKIFGVIESEGGKLKRSSIIWREKWSSLQFIAFLNLQIGIDEIFNKLTIKAQRARNTYPFYRINYLLQCRKELKQKIAGSKELIEILNIYNKEQFNTDYNIIDELHKKKIQLQFPSFCDNIDDLLKYEWKGWDLTEYNMFSNYTEKLDFVPDASQRLTEEKYIEIFGTEASPTPDDGDSDYQPESEEENKDEECMNIAEETKEIEELINIDPLPRNKVKVSWIRCDEYDFVDGCESLHDECPDCNGWIECIGCGGWMCSVCVMDKYGFTLNSDTFDFVKNIDWNCSNCMQALIDCVKATHSYLVNFYDKYFGEEQGRHCMDELRSSFDARFIGLSIDKIVDKCRDYGFDAKKCKDFMMNSAPFLNEGVNEFLSLYADLWNECKRTKWSVLFGSSNTQIKSVFGKLKKEMVLCSLSVHSRFKRNDQQLDDEKIQAIKDAVFLTINEKINRSQSYSDIRFLWNLAVSRMGSEAIVESINSYLRQIYDDYRQKMEIDSLLNLLQSKLLLPTDERQKDIVVGEVNDEYRDNFDAHDDHHICDRSKRLRNGGLKQIIVSESVDKFNQGKGGIFELDFTQ